MPVKLVFNKATILGSVGQLGIIRNIDFMTIFLQQCFKTFTQLMFRP